MNTVFGFIMKSPFYGKYQDRGWYNGYIAIAGSLVMNKHISHFDTDEFDTPGVPWDINLPREISYKLKKRQWEQDPKTGELTFDTFDVIPVTDIPNVDDLNKCYVLGWDYGWLDDTRDNCPLDKVKEEVRDVVEQLVKWFEQHKDDDDYDTYFGYDYGDVEDTCNWDEE